VLADVFGTDNVSFTLPSQNLAIAPRSYTSFSQAAEESAVSRLYGGIHWSFDNNVGLAQGSAVGRYVVANFLRPAEREAAAGVVNGELIVIGTDRSDFLDVVRSGVDLVVWANGDRLGRFNASVASIVVDGRAGHDLILLSQEIRTSAQLYGGSGNDLISGGGGDDRIFGEDGWDLLLGNSGNDWLDGGTGIDFLFGGQGDDWLDGGPGLDFLDGGPGRDHLFSN
jgi:Ca2+-binding RTX toxin-like protein